MAVQKQKKVLAAKAEVKAAAPTVKNVAKKAPAKKAAAKKAAVKTAATPTAPATPAVAPVPAVAAAPVKAKKVLDPRTKQKRALLKQARALIAEAKKAGWVLSIPLEGGFPVPKLYETKAV